MGKRKYYKNVTFESAFGILEKHKCKKIVLNDEKYKNISKVSSFLAQISKEFEIELQSSHEYYDKVKHITQICKMFSIFK